MLTSISHDGVFDITTVLPIMGTAVALGLLIALLYRLGEGRSGKFQLVLAVLPLLVSCVIMIVNGNLGVSVAVLGAFGLVRFRSAAGTAAEIGFLFFSMAVGLAAGMGFLTLAVLIAVAVSLVLLLLQRLGLDRTASRQRQLRVTIPEDLSYNGLFDDLFQAYTRSARLERVKTTNMGTMYELSYLVELRDPAAEKDFIDQLRCRNGNLTVILGLVQQEKNVL